jgi:acyl-ACP thioesterase
MSWAAWDERLEWNMVEIRKLAIINEQRAEARRKKAEKERQALIEKGVDPTLLKPHTVHLTSVSQSTARKMEKHELDLGDICQVTSGKFADKKVLVIKAGIQTKYGMKSITVEYFSPGSTGEKVWVAPELLAFEGENDLETANAIKEADFQEWKARKQAGVPPASAFAKKKPWGKPKLEAPSDGDDSFL